MGLEFKVVERNLSYAEARGIEQIWYNDFGGKAKLLNKIEPIRSSNKNIKTYMEAGYNYYLR
ncbi:hypothetical protein D3C80_1989030 [compost metagenome]